MNTRTMPVTDNADLACSAMIQAKRIALLSEKLADLAEYIADNPSAVDELELAESYIDEASIHVNGIELFHSRLSASLPLIRD